MRLKNSRIEYIIIVVKVVRMSDELVASGVSNNTPYDNAVEDDVLDNNTFDLDLNFDIDDAEDFNDYSMYENRTGLAEDMKFLASMPELCDVTFLVGETRKNCMMHHDACNTITTKLFH